MVAKRELEVVLPGFQTVVAGYLTVEPCVGWLQLSRPDKLNAFNATMWEEFPRALHELRRRSDLRAVVVSGAGRNFCSGIDTSYLKTIFNGMTEVPCPGESRDRLRKHILHMQEAYSALEGCPVPVIVAVHGVCVGAGVDLISACDIRFCSEDASFCVKEVDLAITADLGTLQRLPHIIGHGRASELALTARTVSGQEAAAMGLVARCVSGGGEGALSEAISVAKSLAAKPPLAVRGTKRVLLHSRDHSVADALEYVANWNSAQLMSQDLEKVVAAASGRRGPGAAGAGSTAYDSTKRPASKL